MEYTRTWSKLKVFINNRNFSIFALTWSVVIILQNLRSYHELEREVHVNSMHMEEELKKMIELSRICRSAGVTQVDPFDYQFTLEIHMIFSTYRLKRYKPDCKL
jgi:hypothetical protein